MINRLRKLIALLLPAFIFKILKIDVIITHDGYFHADEVTAIALWKLFLNNRVLVIRTRDNVLMDVFKKKGFVFFDVGREYNPDKLLFDHHQDEFDVSSAGMVLNYINLPELKYQSLRALIKRVDENDLGVSRAKEFEYSTLISRYNHSNDFSGALSFSESIIFSLKDEQRRRNVAKNLILRGNPFDEFKEVIFLDGFLKEVYIYLNKKKNPQWKAIVSINKDGRFEIGVTPLKHGTVQKYGNPLKTVDNIEMHFVHIAGFLAIANKKEDAVQFLKENGYQ